MSSAPWLANYDPGVMPHLAYPRLPVFDFLDEAARRSPGRTCIIYKDKSWTYRQVAELSDAIAGALLTAGLGRGERVGLFMPNSPEFILAYFGILKAGGVAVAINPLYTPPEIIHQVEDAGVEILVAAGSLYERIKKAQPETAIRRIYVTGEADPGPGDLHFDQLIAGHAEAAGKNKKDSADIALSAVKQSIVPDDVALFQYTGGTTGIPKAAVVLHRNLVTNTLQFKTWMSTLEEEKEVFLLGLPIFHIYGMVCGMLLGLALRAALVVIPNPRDISDLLAAIQVHRVTYFPAAPTLYNAINNHAEVNAGKVDLTSIKACISGSAPLMKETKEKFERLTGGRICEGYGLSEAPTATHCNPLRGENRIGSIGLPLPDVDARIISIADGVTEAPVGESGELVIRSPQVMKEYHHMPVETQDVLRQLPDGSGPWLFTGDIARMDAEGYFYIVDRKKELIKVAGYQVWPREVEEALSAHPKILEAGAAGIPDAYRGETVKAWIVLKPGESLTEAEIKAWCRDRLAPYKIPSQIEFRGELPKTIVGKTLRRELVRQHLEKTGEQL
jgi:long-chain acyl-CoA synthetase